MVRELPKHTELEVTPYVGLRNSENQKRKSSRRGVAINAKKLVPLYPVLYMSKYVICVV